MDWIEQVFGIEPDLGSGSLELLIAGAVVLILAAIAIRVRASARNEQVR